MSQRHRDWPRVCISDVCESIIDCVNKTATTVAEVTPYKMIRTTNVKGGWVNLSEVRYVSEEVFTKWTRRQVPKRGDVILTREAPLGEVGMLRSNDQVFLGQRLVSYRAEPRKLDNRFLLYSFQSADLQAQFKALGSGATVEHIRVPDCEKWILHLPPLNEQHRIASILSAYDNLIENNTRRIAILEEMARRLYEEWFVRIRFPGHEQVRMVESELGLIPEGWACMSLLGLATVKYGKNLPTNRLIADGKYPVYGAAKVIGRYNEFTRDKRTIIAGCRGSVGEFQITAPCCFVTNNSFTFDPDLESDFYWLYHALKDRGLTDVVGGAAQPQITLEGLTNVNLMTPSKESRERFGEVVRPVFNLKWILEAKNANLRAQRDLLLPKLISGEIDVSAFPEPEALAA